jgi:phospholipid/cholesterol/gamma-HCH transport system permease protein
VTERRILGAPRRALAGTGRQIAFAGSAYRWAPRAVTRYRREILRHLAGVGLGTGRLAMVGGTVVVVAVLTGVVGLTVATIGYANTARAGADSLVGFLTAYLDTRFVIPVMCGIGLITTIGAGFTSELGAMRTGGELDALEAMAVRPLPFMVTTRLISSILLVVPLYVVAAISSFGASRVVVTLLFGQAAGTYDHYFATFLRPADLLTSFVELLVIVAVVSVVHCYYGYSVTGGPVEVGIAVGRAVRLSFIVLMAVVLLLSVALYGNTDALRIAR